MESLDFFFADITTPGSRNVLLADPKPFSFLVRKVKKEYIVSHLNADLIIVDEILPMRKDSPLHLKNPHLQSPLEVFNYMRNISSDWLHPVTRDSEIDVTGGENVILPENACQICGLLDPSKSHCDKHRIWYCAKCDKCVPKNLRNRHKCGGKTNFKCDYCDYFANSDKARSDHMHAVHMQKFKCQECNASFGTKTQLCDHQGREHGGGFMCQICGTLFSSVGGRNSHIRRQHRPDNNNNTGDHEVSPASVVSGLGLLG